MKQLRNKPTEQQIGSDASIIVQNNDKLLEIKNLVVQYITDDGIVEAVNGINLIIGRGQTLGLVGETGAGKTTTALSILRILPQPPAKIVSGEIYLNGENLLRKTEKQMHEMRGRNISMIFQDPMTSLNPVMTVGQQIMEVILLHNNISRLEARKRALEMLELVGIPGARYIEYPHQFSGGMKQRVMIAIALACNPHLLIADEPTTALDVTIQAQVLEMMNELKSKFNTSLLLITHDLGVVAETCDYVAIMYAGEIVEKGSVGEVFKNPYHPYTQGLFNAIPNIYDDIDRLKAIYGMPADPTNLPNGCKFHPRCPKAQLKCQNVLPKGIEVTQGHIVHCLLYDKANEEVLV
jgi:peptide/nickel transport system ATP-binding protein